MAHIAPQIRSEIYSRLLAETPELDVLFQLEELGAFSGSELLDLMGAAYLHGYSTGFVDADDIARGEKDAPTFAKAAGIVL